MLIARYGGLRQLNQVFRMGFGTINTIDAKKDYYKVLGVGQSASEKEIKSNYYKLAKQYHPDVYKGSSDKFKEVSEAYEVVGNKDKRKEYDGLRSRNSGQQQNPFGSYSSTRYDPFSAQRNNQDRYRRGNSGYDPNEYQQQYSYYWESKPGQQRGNPNQSYYYQQQKYYNQRQHFDQNQAYNSSYMNEAFKDFFGSYQQMRQEAQRMYNQQQQNQNRSQNSQYYNQNQNRQQQYSQQQQQQQQQQGRYSNFARNQQQQNKGQQNEYERWQQQQEDFKRKYQDEMRRQEEQYKMEEQQRRMYEYQRQQQYDQWRRSKEEMFVKDVEKTVKNIKDKAEKVGSAVKNAKSKWDSFFGKK